MTCPLCGAADTTILFTIDGGAKINRCCACTGEFIHPQLSDAEIARLYTGAYYRAWGGDDAELANAVRQVKHRTFERYFDLIAPWAPAGKLLDVGCAMGYMLEVAKARGHEPYGVEYSAHSAAIAREQFGPEHIFQGTIEGSPFADGTFAAVSMIDLLEHTRNPRQVIEKAVRLLAPGGVLLIVTPDTDSLSRRIAGRRWPHYKSEHLYYFNRASLRQLVAGSGLIEKAAASVPRSLSINYLCSHMKAYPRPLITPLAGILAALLPGNVKAMPLRFSMGELVMVFQKI